MPLTNAQKQKNHRQRQADRMARYRSALERVEVVLAWLSDNHPGCYGFEPPFPSDTASITEELKAVREALAPDTQRGGE